MRRAGCLHVTSDDYYVYDEANFRLGAIQVAFTLGQRVEVVVAQADPGTPSWTSLR